MHFHDSLTFVIIFVLAVSSMFAIFQVPFTLGTNYGPRKAKSVEQSGCGFKTTAFIVGNYFQALSCTIHILYRNPELFKAHQHHL